MQHKHQTIALFGGSFDPPHLGHKAVVEALTSLDFIDKIVIMPTFLNPLKSESTAPASLRLRWLKEIFSSLSRVEVSSFEVLQNKKVPTIDTVEYLLKKYYKIYLVIGADNLKSLDKWYKIDELKELVTFIIAQRDDLDIPEEFISLKINEKASSSQLRQIIQIDKLSTINKDEIKKYYKEHNER